MANNLPDGVSLRTLGERRLKDIDEPEALSELVIPDVPVTPEPDAVVASPDPGSGPPPTFGQLVGVPGIDADMPGWLSGLAGRFLPPTHRAIEERVLAELGESMRERAAAKRQARLSRGKPTPALPPSAGRQSKSVADEIAQLRELRDSGALSDDQYERAVERVISADS